MENSNLNFNEFKNTDISDWMQVATKQLKGDDPKTRLNWSTDFGLPMHAYFDSDCREESSYLRDFFSGISSHTWRLFQPIEVSNEEEANRAALEALNGGCDGILFKVSNRADLDRLTKNILFEHCEVSFFVSNELTNPVKDFCNAHNVSGFVITLGAGLSSWHSGHFSQTSGLANLTEMIISFAKNPCENPKILLDMSQDFFHELARIRAIRYLFWRVADVAGIEIDPNNICIHCEPIGIKEESENLFTHATAGLAAVIGGANSVSFNPLNSNERISRNVGNLIREESKIASFQNAGTGSFFIDTLTDQMIQHVWAKLQDQLGA